MRNDECWVSWPRFPAESLQTPRRLPPPRVAEVDGTATLFGAACAAAWEPGVSSLVPPPWLRAHQQLPWRRAVAALQAYGGAIVAEPVGAGKTWIALATAAALGGRAVVVAPAVLLPQWQRAAVTIARRFHWHSLERCSRGVPPPPDADLVIIDEAHRFRHPESRRTRTLADFLTGRRALLLTATPIVNRLHDLVTLLRLFAPEGVLTLDGISRLSDLTDWWLPHPALRRLIIRTRAPTSAIAMRRSRLPVSAGECRRAEQASAVIAALQLDPDRGTRRLLQGVLADAAASSDAAWRDTLHRYRRLLLQSVEAGQIGRALLRQFAGPEFDQGVLWSLVAPVPHDRPGTLPNDDLPRIDAALEHPSDDHAWLETLDRSLPGDDIAVIFCRHRVTARLVRRHLGDDTAWVSGSGAGIGPHHLPRHVVLEAFGPGRALWRQRRTVPRLLVATDVAAEGLDLQAAGRIIHLDMPWTAMRRDQRDGRLRRPGQQATTIHVVERHPAAPLERLLALATRVCRKERLAARWLTALEGPSDDPPPHPPAADLPPPQSVTLVGLQQGGRRGALVLATTGETIDVVAPGDVAALVTRSDLSSTSLVGGTDAEEERAAVRAALRAASGHTPHRALVWRIQHLARQAARHRDVDGIAALDRLLTHAVRGGPLGVERALESLASAPDAALCAHRLPALAPPERLAARVLAHGTLSQASPSLRCRDDDLPDRVVRPRRNPDRLRRPDRGQLPAHLPGARSAGDLP